MSFRYIGSKARIVESIISHVGKPTDGKFVDAFSGTGAVAEAASKAGWPVLVNDHLASSAIMSLARLISSQQVNYEKLGGYENAIDELNASKPKRGFIWKEYSPASAKHCDVERMYFTEANAQKIDGIRITISDWMNRGLINKSEETVLVADLLGASNKIANTAGTYGCFLSTWQRQSLGKIFMTPRNISNELPSARMTVGDVLDVEYAPEDTVYLDPPYTKRQYAAYYHILETIALGDKPKVEGVCGIRPWRHIASDYCYKTRAAQALEKLISSIPARRIFLSYSNEGHVPLDELTNILQGTGNVVVHDLESVGRYRPNRVASAAGSEVGEVLFFIDKAVQENRVAA